jgi:predicted DNA-binding mobile mystery protein A
MSTNDLLQMQIERRLAAWYALERERPAKGWIFTIRKALGMSSAQLADRLGMTRQAISDLEEREREGTATLSALRKAAEAMNCDLVYAIVPRSDLADMLRNQARQKAIGEIERIAHTMRLENQETASEEVERLIEERTNQLLGGSRRALWSGGGRQSKPGPITGR